MAIVSLQVATAVVVAGIALRETLQLARHPRDLPLRLIVPGLICLTVAASIGIPAIRGPLDDALGGALTIVVNVCSMTTAYCYAGFFVVANKDIPGWRRRTVVRRELIPLGLTVGLMVVIWLVAPPDIHAHPVAIATAARWQTSVFIGAVELYALSYWILGSHRALVYRRGVEEQSLRTAIALVVIGAAGMAGQYCTGLTITTLYWFLPTYSPAFPVLHVIYLVTLLGGQALLATGLAYPSVSGAASSAAAGYDRALQRRVARWTQFLWRVLTARFPYIRLPESDHSGRVISEITDGLARLGPYYDDLTTPVGLTSARAAAHHVAAALERFDAEQTARWAGELEWEHRAAPYPRIEPDFPHWRARVRWMATLGWALARRGIPDPGHNRTSTGA